MVPHLERADPTEHGMAFKQFVKVRPSSRGSLLKIRRSVKHFIAEKFEA